MENHDVFTLAHDFDLQRVAALFRQSLAKDTEIIEKKEIVQVSVTEDIIDGAVKDMAIETTMTSTVKTSTIGDVRLTDYVEAYNELNKMFPKLGRLFSFISSDVGDKTRILNEHRNSAVGDKYEFIGGMLDYEKNEAKLLDPAADGKHNHSLAHHSNDLPNGSRTLLRLHRALLFVIQFIDSLRRANDQDKMAHMARKAYDDTLAHHHPWLVRKGVHMAVYTLPHRHQLLTDIAGADVTEEDAERVMQETVTASRAVYDVVQKLYENYGLLDLP